MVGNNVTFSSQWGTPCTREYGDCGYEWSPLITQYKKDRRHLNLDAITVKESSKISRIAWMNSGIDCPLMVGREQRRFGLSLKVLEMKRQYSVTPVR